MGTGRSEVDLRARDEDNVARIVNIMIWQFYCDYIRGTSYGCNA
jgi:hypothetical protein